MGHTFIWLHCKLSSLPHVDRNVFWSADLQVCQWWSVTWLWRIMKQVTSRCRVNPKPIFTLSVSGGFWPFTPSLFTFMLFVLSHSRNETLKSALQSHVCHSLTYEESLFTSQVWPPQPELHSSHLICASYCGPSVTPLTSCLMLGLWMWTRPSKVLFFS